MKNKKITIGLVVSALIAVNDMIGQPIDHNTILVIAVIIGALLVGQGMSDWGKYFGQYLNGGMLNGNGKDKVD